MVLTIVMAPTTEPIDVATVKKQCRMDGINDDDSFIAEVLIPGVRDRAELATQRALPTQTWDAKFDEFPWVDYIELPKPPLVSVTSVKYIDTNGVEQTWVSSNYSVDAPSGPRCARGRVLLGYGKTWPATRLQANAVTIRFICGYGDDMTDMPPLLVQGMLIDAATVYENRESYVTGTIVTPVPDNAAQIYRKFKSHPTQYL